MKKFISIILCALLLFAALPAAAQSGCKGFFCNDKKIARSILNRPGEAAFADFYGKLYTERILSIFENMAAYEEDYEEYYEEDYDEYYEDDYDESYDEDYEEIYEYGDVTGSATVCVEAFIAGGGYIIAPVQVDVREGVNCAYLLDELLTEHNFQYTNTGSFDGGFYLSSIADIPEFTPTFSPELVSSLESVGLPVDAEYYIAGQLSEFDFTQGSGWMYSVNNEFPNVGFSEFYLQDGDVMRIQFTLAYGSDIGDSSRLGMDVAAGIFELPDRDKLTKAIAKAGIESCSEYLDIITKPDLTQEELDAVLDKMGCE